MPVTDPQEIEKNADFILELRKQPKRLFQLDLRHWGGGTCFVNRKIFRQAESMDCNANSSIAMSFISNSTYKSAMAFWNWVHFSEERSFILITNFDGCSMDKVRQPWIVSNIDYDPAQLMVHLNATQNFWPEIA
jgi:hypothetical protein